jgi:hypothetical protein
MKAALRKLRIWWWILPVVLILLLPAKVYAGSNKVMGEIQFEGKSKVEKTSGVWVDGQYVGYLKELKGSKTVLLLPGEHVITVRQNGYQDFTERVAIQPGEKKLVMVMMSKAPTGQMPAVLSQVKLAVNPSRAAVFLDDRFVGHVGEFEGVGRGLLIAPGEHKIRIALPGYRSFETSVNPLPNQKVQVKTDLVKDTGTTNDPLLKPQPSDLATKVPAPSESSGPQRR